MVDGAACLAIWYAVVVWQYDRAYHIWRSGVDHFPEPLKQVEVDTRTERLQRHLQRFKSGVAGLWCATCKSF